jgi:hypothetical protein
MDINDDIMNMQKGWVVHYEDGTIITEYDSNGQEIDWKKVPKVGIKSLSIKWHGKHWSIIGKDVYLQKKRGWVIPGTGMVAPEVEFRFIGYWEGNNRVFYRVDDATGEMKMVVE